MKCKIDQPSFGGILWDESKSLDQWARDAANNPAIFCSFVSRVIACGDLHDIESQGEFSEAVKAKIEHSANGEWEYPDAMFSLFMRLADVSYEVAEEIVISGK